MKKIVIFTMLVVLCGCDNSPMGKLKGDTLDPALGKIWSAERQKNSNLWKQAVSYCNASAGSAFSYNNKPNCGAVIDEYLESAIKNSKLNAHPINDPFDKK